MEEEKSVFDKILDPEDNTNIILDGDNDEEVEFEQYAVIPYNDKVYAILRPVKKMKDLDEDTGLVFELEESEEGEEILNIVEDNQIIDAVFDIYENLED